MRIPSVAEVERLIRIQNDELVLLASDLARLFGLTVTDLAALFEDNRDLFPCDAVFPFPHLAFTAIGISVLTSLIADDETCNAAIAICRAFREVERKIEIARALYPLPVISGTALVFDEVWVPNYTTNRAHEPRP